MDLYYIDAWYADHMLAFGLLLFSGLACWMAVVILQALERD